MRHRKKTTKLGRTSEHRDALLSGLVCNLVKARRITTTLAKAKAARPVAERMVTLAKRNTLHSRRRAVSVLRQPEAVNTLFTAIGPAMQSRAGGYTRILKLGKRASDSSEMAILEWVDFVPVAPKKKVEKGDKAKAGDKEAAASK
ncbi:MAG: 50S ribosomal protein L17 [Kiritimatiellae bacterium]|nr:50S ribosomal protein L17 [Kiritimatiellia bacterium]